MGKTRATTWLYDFHTGKPYREATAGDESYWHLCKEMEWSYFVVEDGTEDGVAVTLGEAPSFDEAD
jgi:hypothetical protein